MERRRRSVQARARRATTSAFGGPLLRPFLAHPIAITTVLAVMVRLAHFSFFRKSILAVTPILDAELYDAWARRIAAGDWLGQGVFYANPLYPYFLGVIYRIAGPNADAARLIQHGLGAGTVGLIALLAQRAFGPMAALGAGVLAALYGPFLLNEDLLLTETLVVFLGAASLALCLGSEPPQSAPPTLSRPPVRSRPGSPQSPALSLAPPVEWWRPLVGLAAGLTLGLGLLARPTLLPLAAIIWLATRSPRNALIAGLGMALAIAPVTARNYVVSGSPVLITAHGGETFYVGNRAGADGSNLQPPFVRSGPLTEHEDYRREASRRLGREVDLATSSRYWRQQALADITQDPGRWLRLEWKKLGLLLHAYEKGDNIDQTTARSQISVQRWPLPEYGLVLALGLFAAFVERRRLNRPAGLLGLAAIAYAVGCLLVFVTSRYRLPLLVPLLPFAGQGIATFCDALAGIVKHPLRSAGRVAGGIATVAILLLVFHRPLPAADRDDPTLVAINLGYLREQAGDLDGAVAAYREAIARRPSETLAHFDLGMAERQRGNLAAAESSFARAVAIDPRYADAVYQLAMTREQAGDLDSAFRLFQRAVELEPNSSRFHRDLGRMFGRRGEVAEAIRCWERALALDPADSATAGRLERLRAATTRAAGRD